MATHAQMKDNFPYLERQPMFALPNPGFDELRHRGEHQIRQNREEHYPKEGIPMRHEHLWINRDLFGIFIFQKKASQLGMSILEIFVRFAERVKSKSNVLLIVITCIVH
jgi:hypothetical protein